MPEDVLDGAGVDDGRDKGRDAAVQKLAGIGAHPAHDGDAGNAVALAGGGDTAHDLAVGRLRVGVPLSRDAEVDAVEKRVEPHELQNPVYAGNNLGVEEEAGGGAQTTRGAHVSFISNIAY